MITPFPEASSLLRSILFPGLPTATGMLGIESPTLTILIIKLLGVIFLDRIEELLRKVYCISLRIRSCF